MKSFLLGATILTSVAIYASVASAADAVVYEEAAIADVPASLTGFYAGLQVGYQWGDLDFSASDAPPGELDELNGKFGDQDGGTGGLYAGYNWQMNDRWLVGGEADINYIAAGKGDSWIGSARLRAGYLVTPDTLLYGTGGLAFGEVNSDFFDLLTASAPPGTFTRDDGVAFGWTIGAGVEHWFSEKVSMKLEYLYTDLGEVDSVGEPDGGDFINTDFTSNTVRAGIALHF